MEPDNSLCMDGVKKTSMKISEVGRKLDMCVCEQLLSYLEIWESDTACWRHLKPPWRVLRMFEDVIPPVRLVPLWALTTDAVASVVGVSRCS